ncbi:aspartate aminotransferase family protein [Actinomadura madurae]|uniref:aspartate aminotransferase family protein n=1 Tax=Actinomadura madurae TaxID=1993 RepID=UPI002026FB73|nr:aminotransferase class III-fold pyridoxal phosphate-dependent enzyme [Actinomadura madurae]MCP9978058.1 aminotransferase class III-fold pyridoxal phosphate-dependent enzyme [Actinomadura madurae]MCQ0010440.1 aminotransferase class III-fold pyridoxal phosphate-dependent enzyme [Actinomadura madurae]URM94413.1 aminotransferase class III-fold pyridoxal phosphate-dependent enzyme [Actinomadura madurae]URN05120.1 aminotransferase class III-fold pyridoxal phosphate-dependent enzyme [Actinomadura m
MATLSPLLKQATPVLAERGEGVYLYDTDGRRHLDFTAGIGVTNTGHCHPRVVEAAQKQVGTLIHGQYTTVMHQPLLRLTEALGDVLPDGLDSLFFLNSGSEAVEASIRLARHATGRQNIVVFHGSFHGRTMGAAALTTAGTKFRAGIGPLMPGAAIAPFPQAYRYGWPEEEATRFALRELDYLLVTASPAADTAAFVVEPVLGEGGYIPAPPAFLEGLRERADRHGILLIMDEVQTGFGRTGRFWGHEHSAARPDVLITAKGLASGFPLSAIAAPAALMEKARPGSQGGTYGGNAVACAAALATLQVIADEDLVGNAARQGARLNDGLRKVAADHPEIGDVRGLGLMQASEFTTRDGEPDAAAATRAHNAAAERGLLLLTCGAYGNVVRMIPPLIVDEEQVDDALGIWSHAVADATG